MGFHCETSTLSSGTKYRTIGMIRAEETADYEVYMITLTPTSDDRAAAVASNAQYATKYQYAGTEKAIWVDDEANLGDFEDESLHYTSITGKYNYSVGGDPIVPGLEIFNRHGMLVTYYVRAKVTEDSLSVHYIDQTANQEFYNYNIAVTSGTLFNTNIGLANPWKGNLSNGSVTNLQGNTQTVSADLSTMPAIGAQYRYSDYTCVQVTRSEDGKDIYLYYTFNDAHSFVADFGLSLNITKDNLNISGDWTSSRVSGAKYGTATVDSTNGITYTPTEVLTGIETLQLTLTNDSGSATHQIYIYPATTVYYEEGFADYTGSFTVGSKGSEKYQATEAAGGKNNNYGFDSVYNGVQASNNTQATSTAYGDKATFSFTGTGVGIYANCDDKTGKLFIWVKNSETNKIVQVQTALLEGNGDFTQGQKVTGYNVPVAVIEGLPHDSYEVTISHVKPNSSATGDTVNLDGFRVYGTLDNNHEVYQKDGEANPTFVELRDSVLVAVGVSEINDSKYADQIASDVFAQVYSSTGGTNGAIVISSENAYGKDNAQDLLENGPKNELYLRADESVVFSLNKNCSAQIGLKALNEAVSYTMNGESKTLNTSTDMFYSLGTGTCTITNNSNNGAILSITELKLFGDGASAESAFLSLEEADLVPAIMSLRSSGTTEPVDPADPEITYADASLQISVADYSGGEIAAASLSANGAEGEEAVFTADAIAAAAAGVLPAGYGLDENSAISDEPVKYGETGTVVVRAGKVATLVVTYKKLLGKTMGTVTLTKVQTSSDAKAVFKAAEIKAAVPDGCRLLSVIATSEKVTYGYSSGKTVYVY